MTSWIIYTRFLQERVIKDIPMYMTEYRFIVLLYICTLYFIIIISLLLSKAKEPNYIIKTLLEVIYTPLITLDHLIKYNRFIKEYYYNFMYKFLVLLQTFKEKQLLYINIFFQVIPRVFLVIFLLLDTFYFHKLDILYKFILVGTIPFIHRYIKHSIKDLKDHYVFHLGTIYDEINIYDTDYNNPELDWAIVKNNKDPNEDISIKGYVELRTKQILYGIPSTQYEATPMSSEKTLTFYKQNHHIDETTSLTEKDYDFIRKEYYCVMPLILKFNVFIEKYSNVNAQPLVKRLRTIIFILYFICWFYILVVSYYKNPIELIYCTFLM